MSDDAAMRLPAWLLERADDAAARLDAAGEPVTPEAVADAVPLSLQEAMDLVALAIGTAAVRHRQP